ncbi:MAG: phenylalanine--tRNA ligase subunit alpha [SAR324 cluster bacterium]|nr:phenylalanine--tRNA ligase subunit alpha [SAR324 cluster bacterium]
MLEQINMLREKGQNELNALNSTDQLPEWYYRYLGRKGDLTSLLKQLGTLSSEERPATGKVINEVKQELQESFELRQKTLRETNLSQQLEIDDLDVTLPGRPCTTGHLHLTTQTLRLIYKIFQEMGFQVYEAPEVESDEFNFQLLNIPEFHPARDMWDTFWVNDEVVLRTHTSPGQIWAMREYYPEPIRVILPGKCYRFEQITPRSEHQFFQVEGLAIGKNIRLTDLIGVMSEFAHKMYGVERKVRFRGSYFPFTEPSIEIDMSCSCGEEDGTESSGCRLCKYTGWLEVAGAGMVHPTVLRNGGYDPEEWSGFAFGMGVERPALLKHNIDDIRYFYGNDLRFLQQF